MESTFKKYIIRKYYSERAEDYDLQKSRTWKSPTGFERKIVNEVITPLKVLKRKSILEVCIGTGRTSLPLLKATELRFVGLDISREMLRISKAKLVDFKPEVELVSGDAEHLPFADSAFEALLCISAMHYFSDPEGNLSEFSRVLQNNGLLVYGDLTLHERDNSNFLNRLEKTVSLAHERYCKPSEIKELLENKGFRILKMLTIPYRKSYQALIEDKGRYFGVELKTLKKLMRSASYDERRMYKLDRNDFVLFYTTAVATKTPA